MHFKLLLLVLVMTAYYQRFSTIVASMTIKGLKFEGCQRYIYIYIYSWGTCFYIYFNVLFLLYVQICVPEYMYITLACSSTLTSEEALDQLELEL